MLKLLRIALIAGAALPASGCYSYLARQDLIEPYSGDAVATNLALQMADPWPRYVYDTDIETSGQGSALCKAKLVATASPE